MPLSRRRWHNWELAETAGTGPGVPAAARELMRIAKRLEDKEYHEGGKRPFILHGRNNGDPICKRFTHRTSPWNVRVSS